MNYPSISAKTIPISDLRRRFGDIEEMLPYVDFLILTKKGKPFATLSATSDVKRKILKKTAGAWNRTDLDDDDIWKEVLKRNSRKKSVTI